MSSPPPLQPVAPPPLHARQETPRRRIPGWVWWLTGGGLLVMLLLALAVGGFASFGWNLFKDQAQAALQEEPAVREQIGQIEEMDLDFTATSNAAGSDEFVFHVRGDRGRGTVQASFVTVDADTEVITGGTLRMSNGRSYPLGVEAEDEGDEATEAWAESP